jgi:hypothetical protein
MQKYTFAEIILISKWFSEKSKNKKSKNNFARVKSSAFSSPGITATKIWFFEKPKTKPVLVYLRQLKQLYSQSRIKASGF